MKKLIAKLLLIIMIQLFFTNIIFAKNANDKIGQLIIIGFEGDNVNSSGFKKVLKQIKNKEISGVILFSKNIKNKQNLILMTQKIKSSSNIPVFIAIDNEGGSVQRLNFADFKSAKEISNMSYEKAKEEYSAMAKTLAETGINVNFAPCVDLSLNPESIIEKKKRSYGQNPEKVSKYASIMIKEHNKQKIITSIKHFPGHGCTKGDTHKGLVDNTITYNAKELEPYKILKNCDKLNMVMVSHVFNSNFDENYPASLSEKTIDILKNEIGYKGVIISDDYDMGAIRKNYTLEQIITQSINSGINILLFSNNITTDDPKLVSKIHEIIKKGIKKGTIKEENLNYSYEKVMELKRNLK